MRRIIILTAALLCAASMLAQDKEKPTTVPDIPETVQKMYFKHQAEYLQAQIGVKQATDAAKDAMDALNTSIQQVQAACGDKYQAQMDKDKFPVCVEKPKDAKPAEKK